MNTGHNVRENIEVGTTVTRDKWSGYNRIEQYSYHNFSVNYGHNFIRLTIQMLGFRTMKVTGKK